MKFLHSKMDCFSSNKKLGAGGAMILCPATWNARLAFAHPDGQAVAIEVEWRNQHLLIVSVYAPNLPSARCELWRWLKGRLLDREAILCGDFNKGDEEGSQDWKELAEHNQLVDVASWVDGDVASIPTWSRITQKGVLTQSRLDKFYATSGGYWLTPPTTLKVDRATVCSDHSPLIFTWQDPVAHKPIGHSIYKFNNMHLGNAAFRTKVLEKWNEESLNDPAQDLVNSIARTVSMARKFGREQRANQRREEKETRAELLILRREGMGNVTLEHGLRQRELEIKLDNIERIKTKSFQIQAGIKWAKEGDAPTGFFFKKVKEKRCRDEIKGIRDANGQWVTDPAGVAETLTNFFSLINGAEEQVDEYKADMREKLIRCVRSSLSQEEARLCGRPFTKRELKDTLLSMPKGKSPGKDGLTTEFFQEMWNVTSNKVVGMANQLWRQGTMHPELNAGLLRLIPKNQKKEDPKDWRPIALLTTCYKIIAKAMANRIKFLIPHLVGKEQFGFVHGRNIMDNILNMAASIEQAASDNEEMVLLNLDMDKAYDRIEWSYVLRVLSKMGFDANFLRMVGALFSNASAQMTLNGRACNSYNLKRSIRQGCPLAPLLYAVITEPFMALYVRESTLGNIRALPVPGSNTPLNIQLFADDSNLWCGNSRKDIEAALEVVETHCTASGSKCNLNKSSGHWFSTAPRPAWADEMGIKWISKGTVTRHLGFPIGVSIMASDRNAWLADKIEGKIRYWTGRQLSMGGKLAVLNCILTPTILYQLAVCKPSNAWFRTIDRLLRNFVWDAEVHKRVHWVKWERLQAHKYQGGMGMINLRLKCIALISKLIPRVLEESQPWMLYMKQRVMLGKCGGSRVWEFMSFEDRVLMEVKIKLPKQSIFWGILEAWKGVNHLIEWQGRRRQLDSFLSHCCWWFNFHEHPQVVAKEFPREVTMLAKRGIRVWGDLWDVHHQSWYSLEVIRQRWQLPGDLLPPIKEALSRVPDQQLIGANSALICPGLEWRWRDGTQLRDTSTAKSYKLLTYQDGWYEALNERWMRTDGPEVWMNRCRLIWRGTQERKMSLWLWRLLVGAVPVAFKLREWPNVSIFCAICKSAKETLLHALWGCPNLRNFWSEVRSRLKTAYGVCQLNAHMVLLGRVRGHSIDFITMWTLCRAVLTERIWQERNSVVFQKSKSSLGKQEAIGTLLQVAWKLKTWQGRDRDTMVRLGTTLKNALSRAD